MDDLSHLADQAGLDLEQLRTSLARMSDSELIRFGRAAKFMCSREAQPFGGKEPPRPEFILQLPEAREEWRRKKKQRALEF